ncbi:MAG: TonB-dependent siderophore receptor, partial [Sphingobium sp.]
MVKFKTMCGVAVVAMLAIRGGALPMPAQAQTAQAAEEIAIPAGSLGNAIAQLGRKTGVMIVFDPALARGKRTGGLRGTYTPTQALDRLLAGSGIEAQPDGRGGFTLTAAAPSRASAPRQPRPIRAPEPVEAPAEASEIIVLGKSYGIEAGTKTVAPLRETPNSISVVNSQRIAEQNIFTIDDVFLRTPGVINSGGNEYADFRTRGFVIDNFLVDGVPYNGFTGEIPDLFVYDRVEILRGPAGLFSGSGSPAGSINLVRKRPQKDFTLSALALAGSWNNYRGQLDVSTPIADGVAVRGGVAYNERDMFYDVVHQKRLTAFATGEIDLTDTTKFTFGGHIDRFRGGIFNGLPGRMGGGLIDFPRSTYGGQDFNRSVYNDRAGFAELRQELGDRWAVRLSGQLGRSYTSLFYAYTYPLQGVSPVDNLASVYSTHTRRNQDYVTADLNAVGTVSLFGRDHQLIFGTDFQRIERLERYTPRRLLGNFDFDNPDYEAFPRPDLAVNFISNTTTRQHGIYGQARLSLADPLKLVLGSRISWYEQDVETRLPAAPTNHYSKNGRFTPYAGVVFDFAPRWTAYASFADTFTPQTGITISGVAPKPAVGKQYEIGIKGSPLGDQLLLSFALFQIDQTGRAQTDLVNPDYVISSGKVRSRGGEIEATGQLTPDWTVTGGYAYTHVRYIDDVDDLGAFNERLQPRHSFKLWTVYRPQSGPLERWNAGLGVNWQSSIQAKLTPLGRRGVVRQGGYMVADARLGYQLTDEIELAVTLNNIFDKTYYERVGGIQQGNFYGAPRN